MALEAMSMSNEWLNNLSLWLQSNKLQLNTGNTKYIIFKHKNKPIIK